MKEVITMRYPSDCIKRYRPSACKNLIAGSRALQGMLRGSLQKNLAGRATSRDEITKSKIKNRVGLGVVF